MDFRADAHGGNAYSVRRSLKAAGTMTDQPRPNPAFDKARAMDAPLQAQLDAYAASLAERNPVTATAYQSLIDRLSGGDAGANAPKPGDSLPAFLLPDENGRLVSSGDLLERGPLVISFNRGHWCPFCWLELGALNDSHDGITRMGAGLISITPETAAYSRRLKSRLGLRFPVLTDLDNAYALELSLAISLSAEIKERFVKSGIDLGLYQNNDAWFVPIPATIVVDRHGTVRESFVNADFRRRGDPKDVLAALADLR